MGFLNVTNFTSDNSPFGIVSLLMLQISVVWHSLQMIKVFCQIHGFALNNSLFSIVSLLMPYTRQSQSIHPKMIQNCSNQMSLWNIGWHPLVFLYHESEALICFKWHGIAVVVCPGFAGEIRCFNSAYTLRGACLYFKGVNQKFGFNIFISSFHSACSYKSYVLGVLNII